MSYQVVISRTALKHLRGLPDSVRMCVTREIEGLRDDPRPVGYIKLKGSADEYRVRVGDYRVRYRIDGSASQVAVIDVRHRKDVYRS